MRTFKTFLKPWIIIYWAIFSSLFTLNVLAKEAPSKAKEKTSLVPKGANSDIVLYHLNFTKDHYTLSNRRQITQNPSYDNQPFFTPDNKALLFVSERDGLQTDVYEYQISQGTTKQITHTSSSEYSPKTNVENSEITFVRDGGNPDQTVWKLIRKTAELEPVLTSKEPVGYYAIHSHQQDGIFWSRYGWNIQYFKPDQQQTHFVSGQALPSSPQQIPNSDSFSFVHRQANDEVWIKSFNPETYAIKPLVPLNDPNIDYAWSQNGVIFHAINDQLYYWSTKRAKNQWTRVEEFSSKSHNKISRLAISPNGKMIALVINQ